MIKASSDSMISQSNDLTVSILLPFIIEQQNAWISIAGDKTSRPLPFQSVTHTHMVRPNFIDRQERFFIAGFNIHLLWIFRGINCESAAVNLVSADRAITVAGDDYNGVGNVFTIQGFPIPLRGSHLP